MEEKEGIEVCADKCKCGRNLRLHKTAFGRGEERSIRFYVDCRCGRVGTWGDTPEDACAAFDRGEAPGLPESYLAKIKAADGEG